MTKKNFILNLFILFFIIILFISKSECVIDTAKYSQYALIASNPNTKISFVTLLSKANKTIPISSTNNYEIAQIFNEPGKSFGSSVGLGPALYEGKNITIGVIGDSSSYGSIYVYNIESCVENNSQNLTKCDYLFIQEGLNKKDEEFQCSIGSQIAVGPNFIVSSCNNNLLSKTKSSPISVCLLNLDNSTSSCSNVLYLTEPVWKPCVGGKGQMITTAIDVYENKIVVGLCGICMSPNKSQIQVEYKSAFVIIQVINDTLLTDYISQPTERTESCPSTVTLNNKWVIMGYSEEEFVDMYYKNLTTHGNHSGSDSNSNSDSSSSNSGDDKNFNKHLTNIDDIVNATMFSLFDTIYEPDAIGFGVDIGISQSMLLVSSTGNPTLNATGNVFFYDIFTDNSSFPVRSISKAMVPNLNYKTTYDYEYGISFFSTEVLVVSQDSTLKKMGFDFFSTCPQGSEWSSDYLKCMICNAGQYKTVSSIHLDNSSFELCNLCPHGFYTTDTVFGLSSISECSNNGQNICLEDQFCPDGSVYPINSVPVETTSQTFPNLDETEELDFESTFYNSCYPYFLIILGGMVILAMALFLPWPKPYQKRQQKIVAFALKLNFYSWDDESMTEEVDYYETHSVQDFVSNRDSIRRRNFIRKRRTAVKPVKCVESFCTYYFLIVLVLMIIFIIQFQRINSDISTEIRSLGQASSQIAIGQSYSDAQYLKFVDTSAVMITLDLYGYNGDCSKSELKLIINGCQNKNYMGVCKSQTELQNIIYTPLNDSSSEFTTLSNQSCRITTTIGYGSEYGDTSDFWFEITPSDTYFYVQRIVYNVSTNNQQGSINTGNSFVSGVIQPLEGTILRPSATVSILSMMTMISDCKIKSNDKGLPLIRPMTERCIFDPQSYKEFSFISNSTSYIDTSEFHSVTPTFQFNIHFEKSVFYRYVMNSHSTSFGQIITVILFAILDVFWIIEVVVPLIQAIVGAVEEHLKSKKQKENGEYYEKISSNELEGLIKNKPRNNSIGNNNHNYNYISK